MSGVRVGVLGAAAQDQIVQPGGEILRRPGGTPHYAARALRAVGAEPVAIETGSLISASSTRPTGRASRSCHCRNRWTPSGRARCCRGWSAASGCCWAGRLRATSRPSRSRCWRRPGTACASTLRAWLGAHIWATCGWGRSTQVAARWGDRGQAERRGVPRRRAAAGARAAGDDGRSWLHGDRRRCRAPRGRVGAAVRRSDRCGRLVLRALLPGAQRRRPPLEAAAWAQTRVEQLYAG